MALPLLLDSVEALPAFARLDDVTLVSRIRARDVRAVSDSARLGTVLFASAPRRPIMLPVLLAAIAALLAESVVAGIGQRRAA